MAFWNEAYAVGGAALVLAAFVLPASRARRRPAAVRALLVAACLAVPLLLVGGLPLWCYFRAVVWEMSITTTFLLLCVVLPQLLDKKVPGCDDLAPVFYLVGAAGIVFYAGVIGFLGIDVYRLGYQPLLLLFVILVLSVGGWSAGKRIAAVFPVAAVAAFDLHLLDSCNLWDYLIDPPVTVFAWGWIVYRLARRLIRRAPS